MRDPDAADGIIDYLLNITLSVLLAYEENQ